MTNVLPSAAPGVPVKLAENQKTSGGRPVYPHDQPGMLIAMPLNVYVVFGSRFVIVTCPFASPLPPRHGPLAGQTRSPPCPTGSGASVSFL
jgi:hypothetical protein